MLFYKEKGGKVGYKREGLQSRVRDGKLKVGIKPMRF